ncbi:MAG: hypothetical protein HYZ65_11795 [Burkholderiales bacterium]|nr:hypothetical protein [Burkholderiales bacterium]
MFGEFICTRYLSTTAPQTLLFFDCRIALCSCIPQRLRVICNIVECLRRPELISELEANAVRLCYRYVRSRSLPHLALHGYFAFLLSAPLRFELFLLGPLFGASDGYAHFLLKK